MAMLFGLFQGGMPLIGFFAGNLFADFFNRYAPWIALALLAFIGGKMIWESLHEKEQEATGWQMNRLLVLAVATSIDALATGVIFIPVPERLWLGVGIIGLVSFLFSVGGYHIGKYMGERFTMNVELVGGIILVLIGIKIWAEGFLCS
jgi:putative Mn2+ efflux pump MntP